MSNAPTFPTHDPTGSAGASVGEAALEVITEIIAPNAAEVDVTGVKRATLDEMARVGLLGKPLAAPEYREASELIAGSDASTWFCWVQHQTPLRILEDSAIGIETPGAAALKADLLPQLRDGDRLAAIAFAHVRRPGKANPVAKREPGGWRLNGTLDWVTSWDIADDLMVIAQGADDDQDRLVCCLLPAGMSRDPMTGVRPGPPLQLLAMSGTHTRPLILDDVFIPLARVGAVLHRGAWLAQDRVRSADASPAAFGVTRGAISELATVAAERAEDEMLTLVDSLVAECRSLRARAYDLMGDGVDPKRLRDRLRLRAASLDLALRATSAVVIARSGASMLAGGSAERRVREAHFLQIQAQTQVTRRTSIESLIELSAAGRRAIAGL